MSLVRLGSIIEKKARKLYKSNVEFANVCDLSEATIRRIYAGKQNITIEVLTKIAGAIQVKASELLKEANL